MWHLRQKSSNIRRCRYYFLLAISPLSCPTTFSLVICYLILSSSHFAEKKQLKTVMAEAIQKKMKAELDKYTQMQKGE